VYRLRCRHGPGDFDYALSSCTVILRKRRPSRSEGLPTKDLCTSTLDPDRHYSTRQEGAVEIESHWTARRRELLGLYPVVRRRDVS
jgi:hypothetical protein